VNRISREITRSLRQLEKELGYPVFTWAGTDYVCVTNEATAGKILGLGGFAVTADLVLFVRAMVLPIPGPTEKQTLTYAGRKYRIDQRGMLPGQEVVTLVCNDATQGM
jgi:hypothetical protein